MVAVKVSVGLLLPGGRTYFQVHSGVAGRVQFLTGGWTEDLSFLLAVG